MRINVNKFKNCSRSEVASTHLEENDELYAVALTQLLDELKFRDILMYLTSDDVDICRKAINITSIIANRYKD